MVTAGAAASGLGLRRGASCWHAFVIIRIFMLLYYHYLLYSDIHLCDCYYYHLSYSDIHVIIIIIICRIFVTVVVVVIDHDYDGDCDFRFRFYVAFIIINYCY